MNNVLTIATGVFLGEFVWAIVLFIILYILFRHIVNSIKTRFLNTGFRVCVKGSGFLKDSDFGGDATIGSVKRFVRYSGNTVSSFFGHIRH